LFGEKSCIQTIGMLLIDLTSCANRFLQALSRPVEPANFARSLGHNYCDGGNSLSSVGIFVPNRIRIMFFPGSATIGQLPRWIWHVKGGHISSVQVPFLSAERRDSVLVVLSVGGRR
jgi:hypothetical protein